MLKEAVVLIITSIAQAEHNEGILENLEEISLHQLHIERIEVRLFWESPTLLKRWETTYIPRGLISCIDLTSSSSSSSSNWRPCRSKVIASCCKHLKILYLQNNLIPKIGQHREISLLNIDCLEAVITIRPHFFILTHECSCVRACV